METIGILGGTFDPVHHGHLILARDAVETLGLARMIFVPAAINPHKLARGSTGPAAPAEDRLAMLRAATAGELRFAVDDCELRRAGPSFTIDTVRELRARWPAAEFILFIGADNIAELPAWRDIDALRALARFAVFARGDDEESTSDFLQVADRRIDISATEIRRRVAAGEPIRYLVPEAVAEIIRAQRLYANTLTRAPDSESEIVHTLTQQGASPSPKKP